MESRDTKGYQPPIPGWALAVLLYMVLFFICACVWFYKRRQKQEEEILVKKTDKNSSFKLEQSKMLSSGKGLTELASDEQVRYRADTLTHYHKEEYLPSPRYSLRKQGKSRKWTPKSSAVGIRLSLAGSPPTTKEKSGPKN